MSGLYSLLLQLKLKETKVFKKLVDQMLPQIKPEIEKPITVFENKDVDIITDSDNNPYF